MSVVKYYHPTRGFNSLLNEIFQNDFSRPLNGEQLQSRPRVNVLEKEDHFTIELAAPGLSKEAFELKVDKDILTIKVEQETESEETAGRYTRREFNFRQFNRTFHLPETINQDAISARYENGILLVNLPIQEAVQPKQIEIN